MDISTFQSKLDFIKTLFLHEEWKDEVCRDHILDVLEKANKKIEEAFGWFMHFLGDHKPCVEVVEKLVNKIPSTLSYVDEDDFKIPIQYAAVYALEYVPTLAKEGVGHKVGGEDARGGLLMIDDYYRFSYLVEWDPDALIESRYRNEPLIHGILQIPNASIELLARKFAILLKAGFKYFPNTGGLLFVQNNEGTTVFDAACSKFGTEETMTMLRDILSPNCNYPILHHAFVKAPQHKDLFMEFSPWAYQLKDHKW